MTYTVSSGTLNLTQPNPLPAPLVDTYNDIMDTERIVFIWRNNKLKCTYFNV